MNNNVYFKSKVIMLPSKNGHSNIGLNPKAMFNKPHLYYFNKGAVYNECQHLYITSDEEIKENEYCVTDENKIIRFREYKNDESNYKFYVCDNMGFKYYTKSCKKIIATTDTSLGLPQPSQQFIQYFIEEYNKGNIITKVKVEYTFELSCDEDEHGNLIPDIYLKINLDNTINIQPIKDSWSKEELSDKIHKLAYIISFKTRFQNTNECAIFIDKWIEENL